MSLLDQAPQLAAADAVRLARELYGLDARARPLPSERDQNFLLDTPAGRFVLKLANKIDSHEVLDAQNAALTHAGNRVDFCPRVVPTVSGDEITRELHGHFVRLVTWLPGRPLGTVPHHSVELLSDLGRRLGELDCALAGFDHPALHRDLHWDLSGAIDRSRRLIPGVHDPHWRGILAGELDRIETRLVPRLPSLRTSIIHNDANDHNVLVETAAGLDQRIAGIIDFGDMVHSCLVGDVAVAIAYAVLNKPDPLGAAALILSAYHRANPLREDEVGAVFDFVKLRMCLSAAMAATQQRQRPGDDYLGISQQAIRATLPALAAIHQRFADAALRRACGLSGLPGAARVSTWLESVGRGEIHTALVGDDWPDPDRVLGLDLSVSSPLVGGDPAENTEAALTKRIRDAMAAAGAFVAVGGYLEPRILYGSPLFAASGGSADDRRTVHLGLDYFVEPGTSVRAALPGVVHAFADNTQPLDYGPVIILRHTTDSGDEFFTLYGHLTRESLAPLVRGARIAAGDRLGAVGTADVNGGWSPHLHFQIITDLLDMGCDFPGVCRAVERDTWAELSPDPNLIARLPASILPPPSPDPARTLAWRRSHTGGNVRVGYRQPLKIVRGWMQYLYDSTGRRFLDAYNNVPHVGHCHPAVVRAAEQQLRVLNTNTRYLHDNLARFAIELSGTFPPELSVCYFVSSGSEANELALRLARAHTRRRDVVVLDSAYHGITTTLTELSPYKFAGPGGEGRAPWVHVARLPNVYRGPFGADDPAAGRKYADDVAAAVHRAEAQGGRIAAFIAESCPSVAGQIVFPQGYLERAYAQVRAAGGLCIADEVQTAYGRMGTHFYAFEGQNVVPDIVVLGKPIGNGYPLGAVITSPEIAASFDNGMEFFSTFGGSTLSCAVGLAVLEIVRDGQLQAHAERVGRFLIERLRALGGRHASVGDVRGAGLFLGVELVEDRDTREPATMKADYVVNRMRDEGILIGTDGPHHNVLKIRPPMPFNEAEADRLATTLDKVLGEAESDG